jgi:hypothetical protein
VILACLNFLISCRNVKNLIGVPLAKKTPTHTTLYNRRIVKLWRGTKKMTSGVTSTLGLWGEAAMSALDLK